MAVAGISRRPPTAQAGRILGIHLVDDTFLRVDQRRQLRKQHPANGGQVALPLQHVGKPRQIRLQPVLLCISLRRQAKVVDHRVDVVLEFGNLAARFHLNRTRQVALGHGRRHLGDRAHLRGQVRRQQVHVAGQVLPCARRARHVGLAAEPAFHAHLARDGGHLIGERGQGIGHVVDRFGERRHFALRVHGQFLVQLAVGHRRHHLDDAAHLFRQVGGHEIHGVGQILPRSGHPRHRRLPAELAFGAHFARHASHFRGEGVQLIHHRVDRVLQFKNFALHIDSDLTRQVATRHRSGDLGNIAHLRCQVRCEKIDVVGQVLPGSRNARHHRLTAKAPFRADFARHTVTSAAKERN